MIATRIHDGSGLGNQLHSYIMARVLALDLGTDFGVVGDFKGKDFMKLDMGKPVDWLEEDHWEFHEKKVVNEDGDDVRGYDDRLWTISPTRNTLIDGYWQGEDYYKHRLKEIDSWLNVESLEMPDDLCVIGFRGGEYVGVRDLFLPHSYWHKAIEMMKEKYPSIRFEVHTDDVATAKEFFPDFECIHDIGLNWRSVRYAKHLIIANSSFYILPSLLGEAKEIIAPSHWAGYCKGYPQLEQNVYKRFTYI